MDSKRIISEDFIPDGAKFEDIDDDTNCEGGIPDGAKFEEVDDVLTFENDIPDGAKFEEVEDVVEPQLAGWCGKCGHKFSGQDEIFCPTCGCKREII